MKEFYMYLNAKKNVPYLFTLLLLISNFMIRANDSQFHYRQTPNLNSQIEISTNLNSISKDKESTEEKTSYRTTINRIILNSFFETLWSYYKEFHNTEKTIFHCKETEYKLELTDFYKIISNLEIDEALLNTHPNLKQKLAEFFIPRIVSFIIVKGIKEKEYYQTHTNEEIKAKTARLVLELSGNLLFKFIMVRCYFPKKSIAYEIANIVAIVGSFKKYNDNKTGFTKYFCWKHGTIKMLQDIIKRGTDGVNIGKQLNPKHRKKALRKTLQALIEPFIQCTLDNLENKLIPA